MASVAEETLRAPTAAAGTSDTAVADGAAADRRGKLRVALLVDSLTQPRWAVESFAALAQGDVAEVVAIVTCPGAREEESLLWRAWERMDRRAFGFHPDPLEPLDVRTHIAHRALVPRAELRFMTVDVAFVLGQAEPPVPLFARYGLWRHFFGAGPGDRMAGAAELLAGQTVMPSGIVARPSEGGEERVVYESWSRLFDYSLARTRDGQLAKASSYAERALRSLQRDGADWISRCPLFSSTRAAVDEKAGSHQSVNALRLVSTLGLGTARGVARSLTTQGQWFIASRLGATTDWDGDLTSYQCRLPPADRFWADPFPLARDGRHYIFFEELPFAAGRAHIACVEVKADGSWTQPRKVLERPYHLSYPFLFEHGGALFMVPETGDRRTVEVYRCRRFPDEWTLEQVLLEGAFFTDATLHHGEDRWWMFVNRSPEGTQGCDELSLYHAQEPLGRWQSHPGNPVKSDVRGARPAGRLFHSGGHLLRPGQIGAPIYGHGVAIHRVDRLTPQEYRETEIARVTPLKPRGLLGVHTINRAGELSVMDGFFRRPRWGSSSGTPFPTGIAHGH